MKHYFTDTEIELSGTPQRRLHEDISASAEFLRSLVPERDARSCLSGLWQHV